MESIWRKEEGEILNKRSYHFEDMKKIHWDVIVIGAGITGVLTAYYLQKSGKRVLILEAKTIASGQSDKTTAKVTCQHGLKYHRLIQDWGEKKAKAYAKAHLEAIERYEQLIEKEQIKCDWKRVPAYLYSNHDEGILQQEATAARHLGIDAFFTKETELPFEVKGAVCFADQAQLSPLKLIRSISNRLPVCEMTKVVKIKKNKVITENGEIAADNIVVATHYPIKNVPGFYFMRQHQERSYVLALTNTPKLQGMYLGIDAGGLSFRSAGEYLLLGGGAKRTGDNTVKGTWEMLRLKARQFYPECGEVAHWAAQDCMPHDGIQMIGRYSLFTPHVYMATGFQKWGMTSAMVAAILIQDQICGNDNPYAKIFTPLRLNFWASIGNWSYDMIMNIKGLLRGVFHRPGRKAEDLKCGEGGIVTIGGKRRACYRDDKGNLHSISARCAHLGCELSWNAEEKSWDCPCHGSRYDVDGNWLNTPTKKDAERK